MRCYTSSRLWWCVLFHVGTYMPVVVKLSARSVTGRLAYDGGRHTDCVLLQVVMPMMVVVRLNVRCYRLSRRW